MKSARQSELARVPSLVRGNWNLSIFLEFENGIWGTGNERHKNGKTQIPLYKDSYSWAFQSEITLRTATEQFLIDNLYNKVQEN